MNTARPFELLAGVVTVVAPVSFGYFFWTGRSPTNIDQRTMAVFSSSLSKASSGGLPWGKSAISSSKTALTQFDVKNMSLETMVLEPTARLSASLSRKPPKTPWYLDTWFWTVLGLVALMIALRVVWMKFGSKVMKKVKERIPRPVEKAYSRIIEKVVSPVTNSGPVQKALAPIKRAFSPVMKIFVSIRQSPQMAKKAFFSWIQKKIQNSTPAAPKAQVQVQAQAQAPDLNAGLQRQLDQMKATTKEMQKNYAAMLENNEEMSKRLKRLESKVERCEGWQRTVELSGTFGPRRALS